MMKGFVWIILITFLSGMVLFPIDWPLEEGIETNTFGGNNRGRPLLGIKFETDAPIRSIEDGELLFIHYPEGGASKLPSPLGKWIALDHGDGLISIYGQMETRKEFPLSNQVNKGSVIASSGISGWSNQMGFYFSIFDRKERRWVNPSMIITPREDTQQPNIVSVTLRSPTGQLIQPAQNALIRQGRYALLVNAYDTRFVAPGNPLAPYRILCYINGIETAGLSFETFSARDGVLMIYRNGLIPTKQIYTAAPSFEVGEVIFTRGQANLEILVQDLSGNSRGISYRLQVE